jgi:putative serine protease PepD
VPVLTYPAAAVAEILISTPDGQVLANRKLDPVRAYWIGRESNCDIVIESASVSRRHALVFHSNGRWLACDAGSVGGLDTENGPVRCAHLSADAWVKIGSVYIWLAGASAAPPEWIDARPSTPASGKPARIVRLEIEDLASNEPTAAADMLVVADGRGVIHLCADLTGLGASRGSGAPRLTLGRSTAADLQICDPSVDPIHAVIARGTEQWSLVDAGSSSGILFEGKRWYRKRLEDGITLPVGNFRVSVQLVVRTTAPNASISLRSASPSGSEGRPAPKKPSAFLDSDDSDGGAIRM